MTDYDNFSKEWDIAGESWADFVREGKDYYREEMNNPAFFAVIGDVKGKSILDLACGEGSNTRTLAKMGAKVVGADFSPKMIELARQRKAAEVLGINYYCSDASRLEKFSSGQFDVVTCFMALMDIEHYGEAVSEVARVLKNNGRFIFSITHPCFEWGACTDGEELAGWRYEEGTENALYLEIKNYFHTCKCEVFWTMKRIIKPFKTTSFHRTLTEYFNSLSDSGFVVARLVEPKPTLRGVSKYSSLRKHMKIPHSLIIEAIKWRTTVK
ncbi:MAG: class I SAM-dependent methyltransferase [Candidatus Bathyarchaeota archaeon]|nr:class I SAM-dependent methyltransferase [Candidatus Bathyarchaeota archaeon]